MGRAELVKILTMKNLSILIELDKKGLTPVHVVCACSDLEKVKVLLALSLEVLHMKSHQHCTPFGEACLTANMPVVVHMADTYPDLLAIKSKRSWLVSLAPCMCQREEGRTELSP